MPSEFIARLKEEVDSVLKRFCGCNYYTKDRIYFTREIEDPVEVINWIFRGVGNNVMRKYQSIIYKDSRKAYPRNRQCGTAYINVDDRIIIVKYGTLPDVGTCYRIEYKE